MTENTPQEPIYLLTFSPSPSLLDESLKQRSQWAEQLESGLYEQGTGALYNESSNSFCCLGVLEHTLNDRELEVMNGTGTPMGIPGTPTTQVANVWRFSSGIRPEDLIPAQVTAPGLKEPHRVAFVTLNDSAKLSFKDIAQLLRGNSLTRGYTGKQLHGLLNKDQRYQIKTAYAKLSVA